MGYLQRIGAIGYADAIFGAGVGSQFFFEFGDFWAEDVLAVAQHAANVALYFWLQTTLLRCQVDEFNGGIAGQPWFEFALDDFFGMGGLDAFAL